MVLVLINRLEWVLALDFIFLCGGRGKQHAAMKESVQVRGWTGEIQEWRIVVTGHGTRKINRSSVLIFNSQYHKESFFAFFFFFGNFFDLFLARNGVKYLLLRKE